ASRIPYPVSRIPYPVSRIQSKICNVKSKILLPLHSNPEDRRAKDTTPRKAPRQIRTGPAAFGCREPAAPGSHKSFPEWTRNFGCRIVRRWSKEPYREEFSSAGQCLR